MHASVYRFFHEWARADEFRDKTVLEVGSYNVNGGLRADIAAFEPRHYLGTDMRPGPGVDLVVGAERLVETLGAAAFDAVICTEMLEHAENWRAAIRNIKDVLRPFGVLFLTARGPGFPLHDYPGDFWRFTVDDMQAIFADFTIETVQADPDPGSPGVFLKARKQEGAFTLLDLASIAVAPVEAIASHQKAW